MIIRLPPDLDITQARARLGELARNWGCPEQVVEDAQVVLSELMSNGILHARTALQVVISLPDSGGLRVEVHDASPVGLLTPIEPAPAAARVLGGPTLSGLLQQPVASPAATGRGLTMVSALASTWGWSPAADGGKVVWAELGTAGNGRRGREGHLSEPPGTRMHSVSLIAVPLRLLKGSEDHLDDLFRELQMASLACVPAGTGEPAGAPGPSRLVIRLVRLAEQVKSRLGGVREPLRRAIWEAVQQGDRLVDLDLLADAGIPAVFERLQGLLAQSAKAARLGFLLTEPPPEEVVAWRRWLGREMSDQIAGRPPRACPFPVVPARQSQKGPAFERLGASGHDALSELRYILAGGGSRAGEATPRVGSDRARAEMAGGDVTEEGDVVEGDVVTKALERAVHYAGASSSAVCILAEDNETINLRASFGLSAVTRDAWRACPVSADLPGPEAVRTSRPLFFGTLAELCERYPVFAPAPAGSAAALACLPLLAGRAVPALGCLVFGFAEARHFRPVEVSFLKRFANELANFVVAYCRQ
jgi:hypothetical protein